MLTRLYIQNYALIDSLDIPFPGNLVVISGQTGAGKSILLGALSLLLGKKADASVIGDVSRNCVVEAQFENGCEETILRRVVTPQGRSRAFVNDEPVTLDELKAVSSALVDLHSQFDHMALTSSRYQLSVLDAFAGISGQVEAYSDIYASYTAAGRRIAELEDRAEKARLDRDFIEFQFTQLDNSRLAEDELEVLESERNQLANSEEIFSELAAASDVFESEECPLVGRIRALGSSLDKLSHYLPQAGALKDRVESVRIELKDIEYEVSSLKEGIRFSPERLQDVEDRLSLLYELMRKHGVNTIPELVAIRDEFASRLKSADSMEEEIESLRQKRASLLEKCVASASALHTERVKAAGVLSSILQDSVRSLEMPLAVFEVAVEQLDTPGPDGVDSVNFLFSANMGSAPKELSKCASGGELSRIMLCIKALVSRYMGMPTMIFDEIDTGVSGSVAYKMGEMIVEMGRNIQVLTITHLPQVASRGNAHYLVYKKEASDGRTHSDIRLIEGEERVREIARMLSGTEITDEALANARSLLNK